MMILMPVPLASRRLIRKTLSRSWDQFSLLLIGLWSTLPA